MKEGKKPEGGVVRKRALSAGRALTLGNEGEDWPEVLSSTSSIWRCGEEGFHEQGWDEELGVPKVIISEVESLVEGRARGARDASRNGQRRLDSVLSRSVVMDRGGEVRAKERESKLSRVAPEPKGREGLGGAGESFSALEDGELREGTTCAATYSSECSGRQEVEQFRVIHFDTLKEALNRLLDRYKARGLDVWHFTDVGLSQHCPTIFWNIVRIFHGQVDVGIAEIFKSSSVPGRRGSSAENTSGRSRQRPGENKRARRQGEQSDVSRELNKKLVEDLNRKIPYFERNGIEYYGAGSESSGAGENSEERARDGSRAGRCRPSGEEAGRADGGGQSSRRSSRRVSFGADCEASVVEALIDKHYKVVRLPIHDYPERLKKAVYRHCILNEICSCTIIERSPLKGRCVVAGSSIRRDDFVLEYKGNLISRLAEAKRLEEEYAISNKGCFMYYFKCNDRNYCIDATEERVEFGPGRLINHSRKNPNIAAKVLMVGTAPRLFFVSKRDIACGEELLFDYGDNNPLSTLHNPWLLNS